MKETKPTQPGLKKYDPAPVIPERNSEWLKPFYTPGNWMKEGYHFRIVMSLPEAYLFSYLVNRQATLLSRGQGMNPSKRAKAGWFYCLTNRIENDLYFSYDIQRRLMKSLERKGFISIEKVGVPTRRWIKINSRNVYDAAMKESPLKFKRILSG